MLLSISANRDIIYRQFLRTSVGAKLKFISRIIIVCSVIFFDLFFSTKAFCADEKFGFKLIIFDVGMPYAPEVITGRLPSQYGHRLPLNLHRELVENNISVHFTTGGENNSIYYLLAFTLLPEHSTEEVVETEPPPAKKRALDPKGSAFKSYEKRLSWSQQYWLQSFSQSPDLSLTQSSPVFTIPFDAQRSDEWKDFLDVVVFLSRWILEEQAETENADNHLLTHAKELLQLLAHPGSGGLCGNSEFITNIGNLTSAFGNNILTTCLYAGAALDTQDLTEWVTEETNQAQLSLWVETDANLLGLVLRHHEKLFEKILNVYSDQNAKLNALKRRDEEDHNVLAMVCAVNPEWIDLIMECCPDCETRMSLINPNRCSWNVLMYAASLNAQSVKLLLKYIPDSDLPALMTPHGPHRDSILSVAASYSPEAVPLIFNACKDNSMKALLLTTQGQGQCTALIRAIEGECNIDLVELLLRECPDKECKYKILTFRELQGYNPLMLAIENHLDLNFVQKLIREYRECDALSVALEATNNEKSNALLIAVDYYPELVKGLIKELIECCPDQVVLGKLLLSQNIQGQNALIKAIHRRKPKLAQYFLDVCPDNQTLNQMLTAQDNARYNILIILALHGYTGLIQAVLSARLTDSSKNMLTQTVTEDGTNALISATVNAPEVTGLLIQSCISQVLTQRSRSGSNALNWVISAQNLARDGRNVITDAAQHMPEAMESLAELCQRDQDRIRKMLAVRDRGLGRWSVLEHAVGCHDNWHVLALLDTAMELGVFSEESERVQKQALEYSNARVLRYLRNKGISLAPSREMFAQMDEEEKHGKEDCRHAIQLPPGQGLLGLLAAVLQGNLEQVRQEVVTSKNVDQRDDNDDTLLHIAVVRHNSPEIVHELLTHGADITAKSHGYTPLQAACLFSGECIPGLLSASLDREIIRGCRDSEFQGFLIPRVFHRNRLNKLVCAHCHDTFDENEIPVLVPCLHQMCCRQCLIDAQQYQYEDEHQLISFQPFKCSLCQSVTRYVIDWSVRALEYIAQLRRRVALGDSEWKKYYPQNEDKKE